MKERWLNGYLIKPTEDGGWQVSLGIRMRTFKTRSKAEQFARSLGAAGPESIVTTRPEAGAQGLKQNQPAGRGWTPRCITGGGRPRQATPSEDYGIVERMINGCLLDEVKDGRWRVQFQDQNPTPAQLRRGFRGIGFHQRTFKTREEAISFAHSLPRTPGSYRKENLVQALVDSVLGNKALRRRLVRRSRTI